MRAVGTANPEVFRRRAALEPDSVLLEDSCADAARRGSSYFFSAPEEVLTASRLADLPGLFKRLEEGRRDGLWGAGYVSYECGYHWEPTAAPGFAPAPGDLPLASFGLYRKPEIFTAEAAGNASQSPVETTEYSIWTFGIDGQAFARKVRQIRAWIEAGDTYQVNLTDRFTADGAQAPAELFARMMRAQPVAFGALLHLGGAHILSASPELFFRQQDRAITVRPMKGTAPRGRDSAEDAARMEWLAHDEKNRAENLMIVDLLRSDLGRIAEMGSVRVEKLFEVERFSTLLQMSSEIGATLRRDVDSYQIFAALFPSGSIVGAPKVRTMQILRQLEGRTRGVYTGAIGYFAPGRRAVFSVAIRTAVVRGSSAEMGAGAGITYSSEVASEYAECLLKANFLREEPFELIETMRVEDGRCALLERHLARLRGSAAYFEFFFEERAIRAALEAKFRELPPVQPWRLRLTLDRSGCVRFSKADVIAAQCDVPDDQPLTAMLWPEPVYSQDRFLRHKTTRRALYDRALAEARALGCASGCVDAIFLNEHGKVTEGAIHSVMVRHGRRWRTPTLDAGVLPGVFRAHLLATMQDLEEADFSVNELLSADEIWLTNAVRGIRRVTLFEHSAEATPPDTPHAIVRSQRSPNSAFTPMPYELPKTYDPAAIEEKWAERWVREDLWRQPAPATGAEGAEPFTMLLPPPNVTGRLHMGHMLNQTEMDILARWHRMRRRPTLWVPGTDHASIATQMMVERQLAGEGTSRKALGREAFLERVWQWRAEYGSAILGQMKRLGASVDWSREYFTMDENLSRAVREAFVRLHEQGLIYRGKYIVNWDPMQQTAVSDLEVTHEERMGKLYHVRYQLADGSGSITIATTRPETMLGDAAVAVNPTDERYAALVGKLLQLPLVGRAIPIVADEWANPEFGTGAVKVTPAHDPNDFAIGTRHNLPQITIMDIEARIDLPGSPYHGLDRYAARERIVEDLSAAGLLVDVKDHAMAVGISQRTGAVIEPRLSTQWFLRTADFTDEAGNERDGLARKAIAAVEEGHIKFTPDQYRKTYMEWMRNIRDWCLSRQLWWGHRIPAWHCADCAKATVARETPAACAHCGSKQIEQDVDVLDTWFSAGLLPFTVFGWPDRTPDLGTFYPTSLLVTGFDILFFWVARMVMLGCHFMSAEPMADGSPRTLKKSVPFEEVYIHALVRDAERQKMSKTKGNVLDPIEVVNQYGTDAVRFTLASMASPGTDIAFNEQRTEGYRAFANKIWNAARFIFMNVERAKEAGVVIDMQRLFDEPGSDEMEARWIRARLELTAKSVNHELEDYRFDNGAMFVYQFFWGDFCDWYLEIVKLRLVFSAEGDNTGATAALYTLLSIFESSLRLLSPFMPFLSEELWQALYEGAPTHRSIALAAYPEAQSIWAHDKVIPEMELLQELVTTVRTLRKDLAMPEKQPAEIVVHTRTLFDASAHALILQKLAFAPAVHSCAFDPALARRTTADFEVQVLFVRAIDPEVEAARLNKEISGLRKAIESAERQLGNEGFLSKAPPNVVEGLKAQYAENAGLLAKKQSELDALGSFK